MARPSSSAQLAAGDPALLAAIQRARKLLNRRALAGAAGSVVPIPGVDWLVDAALLSADGVALLLQPDRSPISRHPTSGFRGMRYMSVSNR